MRAQLGRIGFVAVLAVGLLGSTAKAQFRDTLQVGDRVRVRVAATRGTTNLFVGNLAVVSADTLVIEIPGGKGSIILARAGISEIAISQGNESRFQRIPEVLPIAVPGLMIASLPTPPGPHANGFRNQRYLLGALSMFEMFWVVGRHPREKWEPVYRWLEGGAPPK